MQRVRNLVNEKGGPHSHHEQVSRYAKVFFDRHEQDLKKGDITTYTQLLYVRWWEFDTSEPEALELLERLLHEQYDPLFPDASITPVKEFFSTKELLSKLSTQTEKDEAIKKEMDVVQRALYIKNLKGTLSEKGFVAWLQEEPVISERNAERYLKLAQWLHESHGD